LEKWRILTGGGGLFQGRSLEEIFNDVFDFGNHLRMELPFMVLQILGGLMALWFIHWSWLPQQILYKSYHN